MRRISDVRKMYLTVKIVNDEQGLRHLPVHRLEESPLPKLKLVTLGISGTAVIRAIIKSICSIRSLSVLILITFLPQRILQSLGYLHPPKE